MPCFIKGTDLEYFSVPKNACTSIKFAILAHNDPDAARRIEENIKAPFEPGVPRPVIGRTPRGRPLRHVHDYYPTVPFKRRFALKYARRRWFCVVRDPLQRFMSAYSNRVLFVDELRDTDPARLAEAGLSRHPEPDDFALNLERYSALNRSIAHHVAPMATFLGTRAKRFDRIFAMSGLTGVEPYCAEAGAALSLQRRQTGGPKLAVSDLSKRVREKLESHYAEDYRIYGRYLDG